MATVARRGDSGGLVAPRSILSNGLEEAEARTLDELEFVRSSLRRAVEAATTQNTELADKVAAQREAFDLRYGEVHDMLLSLIARQAPVATDLRLAMALLHVNDRAERMESQCVNIATLCRAVGCDVRPSAAQLDCLSHMADLADEQVAAAVKVFSERDADGVRKLREHDAAINDRNRHCFNLAVDEASADRREPALFAAMMARAIERIGDNAVDIGQQAAFVATGRLRLEDR